MNNKIEAVAGKVETTVKQETKLLAPVFTHNWPLLAATVILIALWRWHAVPVLARAILMVPMYLAICCVGHVVLRNVFCRSTTDLTAHSIKTLWPQLDARTQVILMVAERALFVLAAAVITAGMLIIFGGFGGAGAAMEAVK